MNTYSLDPKLIDTVREASEFVKLAEAYGAAVSAFGAASARIFEQTEVMKSRVIAQAVHEFDAQFAQFETDEPLNIRLARVTSSAQVEEYL